MKVFGEFKHTLGNTDVVVKFTDLVENATNAVLIESGGTVVLVSVVMSNEKSDLDYFPLSVDFEERFYSVSAILGGRYMRREGRPSQEAVLKGRIIDRTIRPLFPHGLHQSTQVIVTTLVYGKQDPFILGVLGTSIALSTSSIPWNGPVSPVLLGRVGNSWKLFPEANTSEETVLVCGKGEYINMVEVGVNQLSEEEVADAFAIALQEIQKLEAFQNEIIKENSTKKTTFQKPAIAPTIQQSFSEQIEPNLYTALSNKKELRVLEQQWQKIVAGSIENSDEKNIAIDLFHTTVKKKMKDMIFDKQARVDGRGLDDIRPLFAQAGGISTQLHGSGIFYRGGTHILSVLTLGGPEDALLLETVEKRNHQEQFMHHYNFPPFSAGEEVKRIGPPNRREIGHGALAEKALRPVIPHKEKFPYTIRLVSECLSSNGSTSMGSVCASTIALMDGGVPILAPVAGIAMGIVQRGDEYRTLTDIQGPEDHYGDMDFKVAGTEKGITAIQMDVKIDGVPLSVLVEALHKAREAQKKILDVITNAIPSSRNNIAKNAPSIKQMQIPRDAIGLIIGSGGKTIRSIKEKTNVKEITIEDDGTVTISGDTDTVEQACETILAMTKSVEIGDVIDGKILKIVSFGAFVKINEKKDALLHISEFAPQRIDTVEGLVTVGDIIPVVVKEIDNQGKIKVSVKDRDATFFKEKLQKKNKKQYR